MSSDNAAMPGRRLIVGLLCLISIAQALATPLLPAQTSQAPPHGQTISANALASSCHTATTVITDTYTLFQLGPSQKQYVLAEQHQHDYHFAAYEVVSAPGARPIACHPAALTEQQDRHIERPAQAILSWQPDTSQQHPAWTNQPLNEHQLQVLLWHTAKPLPLDQAILKLCGAFAQETADEWGGAQASAGQRFHLPGFTGDFIQAECYRWSDCGDRQRILHLVQRLPNGTQRHIRWYRDTGGHKGFAAFRPYMDVPAEERWAWGSESYYYMQYIIGHHDLVNNPIFWQALFQHPDTVDSWQALRHTAIKDANNRYLITENQWQSHHWLTTTAAFLP